ncbi:MAG TPA: AAA family ATPase [Bacilli bacterium]
MITKIVLENFKSFRNRTTIDVNATNYQILNDTNVYNNVLKGLLFVGSNASGKTNAITSILFLLELLFSNKEINIQDYFCFFPCSMEMFLEFTFKIDNDDIVYGFIYDIDGNVSKEYLELNGEIKFNRIKDGAESKITDRKYYGNLDVDKKTLFIRNIYFNTKFKGYPSLEKLFDYLINSVHINSVMQKTVVFNSKNNNLNILNYLEGNGLKKVNDFFDFFGFNQEVCFETEHQISKGIYAVHKEKEIFLKRNNIDIWIPFRYESLGNQTLLNMLPAILHATENDCILIIDEFSSALHNELEELMIRYFMKNSKGSQIFIVSHSTNLLKTTLLRPDQIYSVNFEDENGSYLKRFSSEGPRESQNLERMYLNGRFDGLPRYKNTINQVE